MERLWAPWRSSYVSAPPRRSADCIFCDLPTSGNDPESLILMRRPQTFVMLNAYPYNNGHLMVIPYAHVADLLELAPQVSAELMMVAQECLTLLRHVLRPAGFNLGMNLGVAAGAGVADHLHLHIVPRWNGDTNFMSTLAETRVLPQALSQSYTALQQAMTELGVAQTITEYA